MTQEGHTGAPPPTAAPRQGKADDGETPPAPAPFTESPRRKLRMLRGVLGSPCRTLELNATAKGTGPVLSTGCGRLAHGHRHHRRRRPGAYCVPGTAPSMSHEVSQTCEVGTVVAPGGGVNYPQHPGRVSDWASQADPLRPAASCIPSPQPRSWGPGHTLLESEQGAKVREI